MAGVRRGAYGFSFDGFRADRWLVEALDDWPRVGLSQEIASVTGTTELGVDTAVVSLLGGRELRVNRSPPSVSFVGPSHLSEAEIIHPFLSPAASVLADWHGWMALHAGGFVVDGGGWLVTAEREGGKSTTLAAIADRGLPVLADDLIVIKDRHACAGPRSIDLREPGSSQFVEDLGVVGGRMRWRMALPSVPSEVPVRGVVKLCWSDREEVRFATVDDRADLLFPAAARPLSHRGILDLLSFDTYVIARPRGDMSDTLRLMADVTESDLYA